MGIAHARVQGLNIRPAKCVRIAKAVISEGTDYERAVAAAREAVAIIEGAPELKLSEIERRYLGLLKSFLENVPEEKELTESSVERLSAELLESRPSSYGL